MYVNCRHHLHKNVLYKSTKLHNPREAITLRVENADFFQSHKESREQPLFFCGKQQRMILAGCPISICYSNLLNPQATRTKQTRLKKTKVGHCRYMDELSI
jgi:hypothetical protein